MYSRKYKYLRALFKCLLLVSSLVLFGNRLTDRFNLCTSMRGGLFRIQHNGHHWDRGHRDFGVRYGKVLSSVDKRYHSPMGVAFAEPAFRLVPPVFFAAPVGYLLPGEPVDLAAPCLFLRGPPSGC
ncbi:MAG TPA: hypothetical protein VGM89_02815 [Puia sp.]